MIPHEEAQARVLALVTPLGHETVPLRRAAGRVLAVPVRATRDQPPFDASAMDGYALQRSDLIAGARLQIVGESGAGHAFAGRVEAGQAVRIFTGAPLPEGAEAVVPQERTRREGIAVVLEEVSPESLHVRPRGGDFTAGVELTAPRRLRPADLALIAAMNRAEVQVSRRPVVAIVSTGDELVQPGGLPRADQIVSSNAYALAALAEAEGAEARLLPLARDDFDAMRTVLDLTEGADLIVTIGGASVGDHDLMAQRGADLGLSLDFHTIALRPGKPLLAGRRSGVPLLGLPGNPVSAIVCAHLFLLPMLRALQGLPDPLPRYSHAVLQVPLGANGARAHFLRAQTHPGRDMPSIRPAGSQDSSLLWTLATSDALLFRPIDDPARAAGETVEWLPL